MVTINLYKVGALLLGAIVVTLIDVGMGIEYGRYPWWKQLIHKAAYMVWGGFIALI